MSQQMHLNVPPINLMELLLGENKQTTEGPRGTDCNQGRTRQTTAPMLNLRASINMAAFSGFKCMNTGIASWGKQVFAVEAVLAPALF